MRTLCAWVVAFALIAAPAQGGSIDPPPVQPVAYLEPGPPADYAPFVDPLSAYGRWFVYAGYGWVWTPTVVSPDWRPYTVGRWVYTDAGWMWLSDEPWGWATCHYGRWFYDGAYGWIWVPDTVWGPAWVCWRTGPAFYGWAPLPPGFVLGFTGGRCNPWIGGWVFVGVEWFLSPNLHYRAVPPVRNVYVYDRTAPEVRTTVTRTPGDTRSVVVPRGPDPAEVSARAAQPVPRYSLESFRDRPDRSRDFRQIDGDRVRITRPEFLREVPPGRVKPSPGARRLEEAPIGGQHRPEVSPPAPRLHEIPENLRGPRLPAPERRATESPRPKKEETKKKVPPKR